MNFVLQPWQLLFAVLSGWVNQRQQEIIEFQNAQFTALLQKLGKKRILLTNDERRFALASAGHHVDMPVAGRQDTESALARIIQCAVKGVLFPVGAKPTRQLVAPAGSTWGGSWR